MSMAAALSGRILTTADAGSTSGVPTVITCFTEGSPYLRSPIPRNVRESLVKKEHSVELSTLTNPATTRALLDRGGRHLAR